MQSIIYPYNEILPTKKAHDVFIFQECASLAKRAEVTLLVGGVKGDLATHYNIQGEIPHIQKLPILRKNLFNISWNLPFFFLSQQFLKKRKPDVVILSVLKQADYHLKKRLKDTFYVYEVHELAAYPNMAFDAKKWIMEKRVFSAADLIVVTTQKLKDLLKQKPYEITTEIAVIPLASHFTKLRYDNSSAFTLGYVGQLYESQGISQLLDAFSQTSSSFRLKIIGGKAAEIELLQSKAFTLGISQCVEFLGFHPPSKMAELLKDVQVFVAPFQSKGKMSYVAHTKLVDYIRMGRPVIAPDLEVVHECFINNKGVCYFMPDNVSSLKEAMNSFEDRTYFEKLLKESEEGSSQFSWEDRANRYFETLSSAIKR